MKEGNYIEEEKDSFDLLNFSNDLNLVGMNSIPKTKELQERLTSTLKGISSTYHAFSQRGSVAKNFEY